MARSQPIALVCSGQVSRSFLARLPGLRENIGPVKASSIRLATRLVNSLGFGYPVASFDDLQHTHVVCLHMAPGQLQPVVAEMATAPVSWHGKIILLCDAAWSSRALTQLAAHGAHTASLAPIEGFEEHRFLVEGDSRAVRLARRLVQGEKRRVVEVDAGGKDLFLAGLTYATSLFTPMAAASVECLKRAGMRPASAALVVERLLERSLRGFVKAGRKSWGGPLALRDEEQVRRELEALFRASPLLASHYTECAFFALQFFRQSTDWLPTLQAGAGAASTSSR